MPFRAHDGQPLAQLEDPLARYFELEAAFEAGRGLFGDGVPLRLAAANLVLCPGDAAEIAAQVRAAAEQLNARVSLFSELVRAIQLVIAAVLLQRGDEPDAFLDEVARVRPLLRRAGLRRSEIYEVAAILALRIRNRLDPITAEQIHRLAAIYEQMRRHHWFLTGPEDYPACAFLLAQHERTPETIAARANQIYEGLRTRAKLWRGNSLQNASNMPALSPLEPAELVERFRLLALAFKQAGVRIGTGEYDEVAVLCFLAQPSERIIETVTSYAQTIGARLRWSERAMAFGLATNLAFVRLLGNDPQLGPLADAKALLDMQTIITARAASGATAGAG